MTEWNKTQVMMDRLRKQGKIENVGGKDFYLGRSLIHRDSEVDGGVYLGQSEREAIVVDSQKYSGIRELYTVAKNKATENGRIRKDLILEAVFQTVREAMPKQDEKAAEDIAKRYGVENDGKISLDIFIEEHLGVCRHDALLSAAILEQFKKEGIIDGKPSVDRNSNHLGGHAWCRYTNSGGEVFILDVAQKFLGKLKDATEQNKWAYERPEDF